MDTKSAESCSPQGFKWVHTPQGAELRWTEEPDLNAVLQTAKQVMNIDGPSSITFLKQRAFTRFYLVSSSEGEYVFRANLPVYSRWKTESEVATMEWLLQYTTIPIPQVVAHMANRSPSVGFEWIITENISHGSLADDWRLYNYPSKKEIVRHIAAFSSIIFKHQQLGMGNLFYAKSHLFSSGHYTSLSFAGRDRMCSPIVLGPIVSSLYISPGSDPVPRGPFSTSRDWVISLLHFSRTDCRARLAFSQKRENTEFKEERDGKNAEGLEAAIVILDRLNALLDDFFPYKMTLTPERSMLFHDNLSKQNIAAYCNGSIYTVRGWESASTVPLFMGCQYPSFLENVLREEKPILSEYYGLDDPPINGPSELYWDHLEKYELTQLRKEFLAEMKILQPEWVEIFQRSQRERDFVRAIHAADNVLMQPRVLNWLTDLESGATDFMSLEERINNDTV